MNRNRRIVVVSAIGIAALAVTTGWSIMAAADWPPEPYGVYSLTGTWYNVKGGDPMVINPEDPLTGKGCYQQVSLTPDVTAGGQMPTAKGWPQWVGSYVRTGPDTWQTKLVGYAIDDAFPKANIVCIAVKEGTLTMTASGAMEFVGTNSIYLPHQDLDGDRLPDPGENPIAAYPSHAAFKPL